MSVPKPTPDPADLLYEWLTPDCGVFFRRGRVLESVATPFQELEVFDTPQLGRMFRLDGCNMTSEGDEFFYHENLVHPAAIAQDDPRTALVVGGGDGGSIEEVLKHPTIERVVMAELDAEVVRMARTHFGSVHRGALDDPRVQIRIGDGAEFVRETSEQFDLVVLDLTDPAGPAEALYEVPFYRAVERVLAHTGTLSLHIGSPFYHGPRFAAALERLSRVFRIVRPYLVHIPLYGASWGMACASRQTDPLRLGPAEIDSRIAQRGIRELRYFNGAVSHAGFALPNYVRELARAGRKGPDGT